VNFPSERSMREKKKKKRLKQKKKKKVVSEGKGVFGRDLINDFKSLGRGKCWGKTGVPKKSSGMGRSDLNGKQPGGKKPPETTAK